MYNLDLEFLMNNKCKMIITDNISDEVIEFLIEISQLMRMTYAFLIGQNSSYTVVTLKYNYLLHFYPSKNLVKITIYENPNKNLYKSINLNSQDINKLLKLF